jgi:sirohydrochlorin ferrochelatase
MLRPAWGGQNAAQALLVLLLIELVRELQGYAPHAPVTISSNVYEAVVAPLVIQPGYHNKVGIQNDAFGKRQSGTSQSITSVVGKRTV